MHSSSLTLSFEITPKALVYVKMKNKQKKRTKLSTMTAYYPATEATKIDPVQCPRQLPHEEKLQFTSTPLIPHVEKIMELFCTAP